MSPARALLRTLRPHQWVKNVFVLAPLVFARHLLEPAFIWRALAATLAFCALSGAVYAFNDVRDVEADRAHPTKRHRPIAAGHLRQHTALVWASVLASAGLATCVILSWSTGAIALGYLVLQIAYTLGLKQLAFVDVLVIAAGFLLRVLVGAHAIAVPASGWVLLCTALLATFLGLGKRAHELTWATRAGTGEATRAALAGYRLPLVRATMLVLAAATLVAYVAYTRDPHTITFFATDRLVLSAPFVGFGLIRFLTLALWRPREDSPTEAMLRDLPFLLNLVAAAAVILYVLYQ